MIFTTSFFMFIFFPITILVYYLIDFKYKNSVLLLASLFFYAWGEPRNIILIIMLVITNYFLGIGIEKYKGKNLAKALLFLGLAIDLGVLFQYKYSQFFSDIINQIFNLNFKIADVALPIGLSFFTFQILSYIIDVYREKVPAQKNMWTLALYILLFPQLIAGPIVRYQDIEKQLVNRNIGVSSFFEGGKRFMIGFSKKVLIADVVGQVADLAFGDNFLLYGQMAWVGILAYTLQIYYDFSGYSDMAIGMGKMFGFDFNENFIYPYFSFSIKEFWRRWHVSLSSWFRDYVYIPLGGGRCKEWRTYVNLLIVFFCTGLWHGASWNFIFWGVYYAIILIAEKMFLGKWLQKIPKIFSWMYSCLAIMFGWIFFRSDTMSDAVYYIKKLFIFPKEGWKDVIYYIDREKMCAMILGIFFAFPVYSLLKERLKNSWLLDISICLVFLVAVFYMTGNSYSPFLYFRF